MKSKIWIYPVLITSILLLFIVSCKKDSTTDTSANKVPELTTTALSGISSVLAISGGNISSDGGASVSARGVCWSTSPNPTIANNKTNDGTGTGSFKSSITGLVPNTLYYMRAYATNSIGTNYGSSLSFTTRVYNSDIDGNVYNTVIIGTQCWMKENLRTTHYSNGDAIPNVSDATQWGKLTTGANCNINNELNTDPFYGRLYNWYAVNDSRKLCPGGWHVSSDAEWTTLVNFLGDANTAGGLMKESGTDHWISPNTGATNSSGFSGIPAGYRTLSGNFSLAGYFGYWWTSSEYDASKALSSNLGNQSTIVTSNNVIKVAGFSVRCIKD